MKLRELIQVCNASELAELYAFWDGNGSKPSGDLRGQLLGYMTDDNLVRRRLRFLSRKLIDLLRLFLSRRHFEANLENIRRSQLFSVMSPHEVEAAVRALVKRGFLFPCHRTEARPSMYTVPWELGGLLRGELQDLDLELCDAFSLARMLRSRENGSPNRERVEDLTPVEQIRGRRAALPEDQQEVYDWALETGYGLLPRALWIRHHESETFPRQELKEALENARVGTVRHLALGEYGINHFDDTVILFEEIVRAEMDARAFEGASDLTVRSLGVDFLSDLSQFLGRLSREKVRLTQAGTVYRTAARKIEEELILVSKSEFSGENLFQFLFELSVSRHLARKTSDRRLALTSKGRTWPRLSVSFKLKELLNAVLDDPNQHFHRPRLQQLTLEHLKKIRSDRWYDFGLFVGSIRHRYLASLDESGIREAYQSRYQYSSEAHMRDLAQLANMIVDFLSRDLHLLGLVDLALIKGKPAALRLSTLACKVFDVEETESTSADRGPRLLVNPDFEILLLPEGDTYDLIQRLDRFAERVSPEGPRQFRITARSVERAVAAGMSVAEILETLSEHSESELPQNIVYSVREFAERVRFVQMQRAVLVSARHKEIIDHVLRHSELRKVVLERLSPRMLALHPDAPLEELIPLLEKDGVFLEGVTPGTTDKDEE